MIGHSISFTVASVTRQQQSLRSNKHARMQIGRVLPARPLACAHGPVPTATAADLPDFCPSLAASTLGLVVVACSAWVFLTTVFVECLDLLFR